MVLWGRTVLYSSWNARSLTCASSTLPSNSRLRHSSRNRPLIPAVTVTQFMMGAAYDPWRDAPDLYGIGVRSREVRASISAKALRWFMAARNSQAASVRR